MVIKKFILIMFVIVLSSLGVFGYGGSGTELAPYTIDECNDFHLLNIDEDYTSKVWITLINDINCSGFSDTYLINKTINGLHIEGNNNNISFYPTHKTLFGNLNINSENSYIQNLNVVDSNINAFFNKITFTENDYNISFINMTFENIYVGSVGDYWGLICDNIVTKTGNNINLERIKALNIGKSTGDCKTFFCVVSGDSDGLTLNYDKVYFDLTSFGAFYEFGSLMGVYRGDGIFLEEINVNEMEFILNQTSGKYSGTLIGDAQNFLNLKIRNSVFFDSNFNYTDWNTKAQLIGFDNVYITNVNMTNVLLLGKSSRSNKLVNSGTLTNTYFNNVFFNSDLNNYAYSGFEGYDSDNLYDESIYSGFDTNIFKFEEGEKPTLKWITENEPIPLTIDCYNLNYDIYEYSNLTYNINCETNELFSNYTFLGNTSSLMSSTLDIEGITYNISEDIYPLNVCIDSGTCKDYNITITSRTSDDIKPVCSPLPDIDIYENTDFDILINCSDRYTNLTLMFSSFPVNITQQIETNQSVYIDNVTLTPPNNDFMLYMTANDSRGNFITLNKFYTISEEVTPLNESFKTDLNNTPTSILFIGFVFFFLILFVLGVMFKIPVFLIFSGIAFLFMGILVLELLSILGVIIILFGVVLLGYALIMFNND